MHCFLKYKMKSTFFWSQCREPTMSFFFFCLYFGENIIYVCNKLLKPQFTVRDSSRETWIRGQWGKYEVIGNLARNCKGAPLDGWMIKLWWDQRPLSCLWSIGQSLKQGGQRGGGACEILVIKIYLTSSGPGPWAVIRVASGRAVRWSRRRSWYESAVCMHLQLHLLWHQTSSSHLLLVYYLS